MNEQLEKINDQAKVLVAEIDKYQSATSINKASADSFKVMADALKTVVSKIKPLTNNGFLKLQYAGIALLVFNLIMTSILIFHVVIK